MNTNQNVQFSNQDQIFIILDSLPEHNSIYPASTNSSVETIFGSMYYTPMKKEKKSCFAKIYEKIKNLFNKN